MASRLHQASSLPLPYVKTWSFLARPGLPYLVLFSLCPAFHPVFLSLSFLPPTILSSSLQGLYPKPPSLATMEKQTLSVEPWIPVLQGCLVAWAQETALDEVCLSGLVPSLCLALGLWLMPWVLSFCLSDWFWSMGGSGCREMEWGSVQAVPYLSYSIL